MNRDELKRLEREWSATQTDRARVECDDNCEAFEEPQTYDEYKDAYIHWREHEFLSGCSHAC